MSTDEFTKQLESLLLASKDSGSITLKLHQVLDKDKTPRCHVLARRNKRSKKGKCSILLAKDQCVPFHHAALKILKPNVVGVKEAKIKAEEVKLPTKTRSRRSHNKAVKKMNALVEDIGLDKEKATRRPAANTDVTMKTPMKTRRKPKKKK